MCRFVVEGYSLWVVQMALKILLLWDLVVRNLYAAGSGFCSAGAHPAGFSAWLMR